MALLAKLQVIVITTFFCFSVTAMEPFTFGLSQKMDPHFGYNHYANVMRARILKATGSQYIGRSPFEIAVPAGQAKFENVTNWTASDLNSGFRKIRDTRFILDANNRNFERRSTWLYPDDGCFARSDLARKNLSEWEYKSPNKIFVFGSLIVKSDNSPQGAVTWWYHVAPIVNVEGKLFVLDPAIEPKHALQLEDWLKQMNPNYQELNVAICASATYDPSSDCVEPIAREDAAFNDQYVFLDYEWQRQLELGRDPYKVLGDNPPWQQ